MVQQKCKINNTYNFKWTNGWLVYNFYLISYMIFQISSYRHDSTNWVLCLDNYLCKRPWRKNQYYSFLKVEKRAQWGWRVLDINKNRLKKKLDPSGVACIPLHGLFAYKQKRVSKHSTLKSSLACEFTVKRYNTYFTSRRRT